MSIRTLHRFLACVLFFKVNNANTDSRPPWCILMLQHILRYSQQTPALYYFASINVPVSSRAMYGIKTLAHRRMHCLHPSEYIAFAIIMTYILAISWHTFNLARSLGWLRFIQK